MRDRESKIRPLHVIDCIRTSQLGIAMNNSIGFSAFLTLNPERRCHSSQHDERTERIELHSGGHLEVLVSFDYS